MLLPIDKLTAASRGWRCLLSPCVVALSLSLATPGVEAQASRPALEFHGRLLVVASDGDMQAQAYAGDRLGSPTRDLLSIIRLDADGLPVCVATIEASNSVVGPPASLSISPDGRYAILIETRGPHPLNRPDARLSDLPAGHTITVVDLIAPERPIVVQHFVGRNNPIAISIRADGKLVAIAYDTSGSKDVPLVLYQFAEGHLKEIATPFIPGYASDDVLRNVAFSPSGPLALVYATKPRLSLVSVSGLNANTVLTRWGNDVPLGRMPFEVRFTADGRFALVNDMDVPQSGTDVRGTIISVAIAAAWTSDGVPLHRVVSRARTGVMPEGLVISPDAQWVATINLERTAYAAVDPHQGFFASVTLLRLEPGTGLLTRVGDFPFAGVLPEAAAFDNSSHYLAVTSFDHLDERASQGSVDFWRIAGDFQDPGRIELVPTGISISLARGAQSMSIVR